jgi:outer membrane protein assembly factor BamC
LSDPFDRAWRRVGLALDRIGFLVEDKDRSKGLFFVRYSDLDAEDTSKEEKGWLDKLAFWKDDDDKSKSKSQPQPQPEPKAEPKKDDSSFTDKLEFWKSDSSDKDTGKASSAQQYLIRVERIDERTAVNVVGKDGKRALNPTSNRILSLLYEQLR